MNRIRQVLIVAVALVLSTSAHGTPLLLPSQPSSASIWGSDLEFLVGDPDNIRPLRVNLGGALQSFESDSAADSCPDASCGGPWSYSIDGSVNLATGTIEFYNKSSSNLSATTDFNYWDALFITIPYATASTVTNLTMTHHLDGDASASNPNGGHYQFYDDFCFGCAENSGISEIIGDTHIVSITATGSEGNFIEPGDPAFPTEQGLWPWTGSYDVSYDVAVRGPTAIIPFYNYFDTVSAYGADLDFTHTSTLDFSAPPGVDVTSASGVFLTQQRATTVPEPVSIILFSSTLALAELFFRFAKRSSGLPRV